MSIKEYLEQVETMPLKELKQKLSSCDSITLSYSMLKHYLNRKMYYCEGRVNAGLEDDVEAEEMILSLLEDLAICETVSYGLGSVSIGKRVPLAKVLKPMSKL